MPIRSTLFSISSGRGSRRSPPRTICWCARAGTEGRLSITWERREGRDGRGLQIDWHERNGPKVKPRGRQGFGTMVIERNLPRAIDASVELTFDPEGVRCRIAIPDRQILAAR